MFVKRLLAGALLVTGISFAFRDSDLDGVEDSVDRCPNTPILELVDRYGCPLRREKIYLRVGAGFFRDRLEERVYGLASVAYALGGFYTSLTLRYYTYSRLHGKGMGDSTLFLGYSSYVGQLYLMPGLRVRVPTGDRGFSTESLDLTPSLVADYALNSFDLFVYSSYTFRGSDRLRNTLTLSGGVGRELTRDLYASVSYDLSQSAVRNGYNRYLSLFLLYNLTRSLYTTLSYSMGLNDDAVDHSATIRLGIRF